jgi:N-acetyl-anhydromuramyl-L-alanine amidase AmpD
MLAKDIPAAEENTHALFKKDLDERVENGLEIFAFKPAFRKRNYFFEKERKKTGIVLHFTAGFLAGDIPTLTQKDNHVSVAYVVARNGRVYELFPPQFWSFHLGKGTVGGNEECSAATIGIEISNIGPLKLSGGKLHYETSKGLQPYCDASETEFYVKADEPFRKAEHFATYTAAQYASVKALIDLLSAKFGIAKNFIAGKQRFEPFATAKAAREHAGVASHVNYRKSGKWDIGPSFQWDLVGAA